GFARSVGRTVGLAAPTGSTAGRIAAAAVESAAVPPDFAQPVPVLPGQPGYRLRAVLRRHPAVLRRLPGWSLPGHQRLAPMRRLSPAFRLRSGLQAVRQVPASAPLHRIAGLRNRLAVAAAPASPAGQRPRAGSWQPALVLPVAPQHFAGS